jgi:hypothetical protein
LSRLKTLNLEIRQQLEVAEARVEPLNLLIKHLHATGLLNEQIFLGDVIWQRAYDVHVDTSSGQIIQASLSTKKGFGAVFWDSEEFFHLSQAPNLDAEAALLHVPFEQCEPAIKALLLPQLELLVRQLLRSISDI